MASKKQRLPLLFTCLVLILGAGSSLANDVYKWVDKDGNIHFSQRPPEGIDSEHINAEKQRSFGYGNDQQDSNNAAEPQDQEEAAEQAPADEEQAAQAQEETFQKDPEMCKKAREYKGVLMRNPIVRKDNKALTIEEKNEEMRKVNEVISIHCEGGE